MKKESNEAKGLINREETSKGSTLYAFCTFAFLTSLYIVPEHIKIFAIAYVAFLLLYTVLNFKSISVSIMPLAFWVAFICLGVFFTLIYGIGSLNDAIEFVISLVMGLMIHSLCNSKSRKEKLLTAVFAVCIVVVIGCLVQLVFPTLLLRINAKTLGAEKYAIFYDFFKYNFLIGFSYQTGVTGFYLGLLAGFLLCYITFATKASKQKKGFAVVFLLADIAMLLMTGKRGELLIVLLAIFVLICYHYRNQLNKLVIILLALGVVALMLILFTEPGRRILNRTLGSNPLSGRDNIYSQLWAIFVKHPIFGSGFSATLKLLVGFTNGHNIYLQVLTENGIIGLLLLLIILIYNLYIMYKVIKKCKKESLFTVGVCVYIELHFLIVGVISNPLYDIYPLIIYMIATGILQEFYYSDIKRATNGPETENKL